MTNNLAGRSKFWVIAMFACLLASAGQPLPASSETPADVRGHLDRFERLRSEGEFEASLGAAVEAQQTLELAGIDEPALKAEVEYHLGRALFSVGRFREAVVPLADALELRRKFYGNDAGIVADTANALALVMRRLVELDEAARLYQEAARIYAQERGPDHRYVMIVELNLGYVRLDQGKLDEAAGMAQSLIERADDPDAVILRASAYQLLGQSLMKAGDPSRGAKEFARATELFGEHYGEDHPRTFQARADAGLNLLDAGRYAEGLSVLKEADTLAVEAAGPDSNLRALSLSNLATAHFRLGEYIEGRRLATHALEIRRNIMGSDHPDTARELAKVATFDIRLGRPAAAVEALKEALAVLAQHPRRGAASYAQDLGQYAAALLALDQLDQAEKVIHRARDWLSQTLGTGHWVMGRIEVLRGELAEARDQSDDAVDAYEQALAVFETALGPEHPEKLPALRGLARAMMMQGSLDAARDFNQTAMALAERVQGPASLLESELWRERAQIESQAGLEDRALVALRRASAIARETSNRGSRATTTAAISLSQSAARTYADHLSLLVQLLRERGELAAEAFELAQFAGLSRASEAIALLPAQRFDTMGPAGDLLRTRQALLRQRRLVEETKASAGQDTHQDTHDVRVRQREQLQQIDARLSNVETALRAEFPELGEYLVPKPVSLTRAQRALGFDEGMLGIFVSEDVAFVWALSAARFDIRRIEKSAEWFEARVHGLRRGLDPTGGQVLIDFDRDAAHALYETIFSPVSWLLEDTSKLVFIPDGPLASLPPGVLITEATAPEVEDAEVPWLIKTHAMTVLPSVNASLSLRAVERSQTKRSFLGVGNPRLGVRRKAEVISRSAGLEQFCLGEELNAETLFSALPALPETAIELREIARTLGSEDYELLLGDTATEPALRDLDLAQYGVMAFATHGLLPGEIPCQREPALILTRLGEDEAEDGILTASEIIGLRLDADLVMLSACNTAGADGFSGGESLSGLARSFFFAGARSLLVTHWAVDSFATQQVTTRFVRAFAEDSTSSRAEALQQAQLELLAEPNTAHPYFWGAFTIVGENT